MSTRLQRGAIIDGRYRLEQPLGEGGIGVVWEAWQIGVERHVAIKFLKMASAGAMSERFEVEARALGLLNHPNCVTIHDFGRTDAGLAYLVMEYLEGEPATAWRGRRLTVRDVVDVGQQVATALHYAHHHGVVHRDLKPENIFAVSTLAGDRLIKVLDFGLAKLTNQAHEDITKTGEVFGTPAYMSPEQLRGTRDAGPASDLYSLGVMLYELLEGRLPFWEGTPLEIGMAHITKPVPPIRRPGVGEPLTTIVHTLLAKDPEDRYPDALALFDALDEVETESQEATLQLIMPESPRATGGDGEPARATRDDIPLSFARTEQQFGAPTEAMQGMVDGAAGTPRYEPDGPRSELADVRPPPRAADPPELSLPERRASPAVALGVVAGVLVSVAIAAALLWSDETEAPEPTATDAPGIVENPPQEPNDDRAAATLEAAPEVAEDSKRAADQPASELNGVAGQNQVQDAPKKPRVRERKKRRAPKRRRPAKQASAEEQEEEPATPSDLKGLVADEVPEPKDDRAGSIAAEVQDTEGK